MRHKNTILLGVEEDFRGELGMYNKSTDYHHLNFYYYYSVL